MSSTPDPTAVLDLYKFVKLATTRRVLAALRSREPAGEALFEEDSRALPQLMAAAKRAGPPDEQKARAALASLRACLLLDQATADSRVRASKLRGVVQRFLGTQPVALGSVPTDPRSPNRFGASCRWWSLRRRVRPHARTVKRPMR